MAENKLQIRAKLLSAIDELLSLSEKQTDVPAKLISELKEIEDKKSVLEILVKELLKDSSENKIIVLTFLLQELADKEETEKAVIDELVNPKNTDRTKTKLVNVLRSLGRHVNYEEYTTLVILSKPYSELAKTAVKYIGESKSKLAVPTLHWVIDNIEDESIRSLAQKSLNMLKLAGFAKDETEEFYKEILKDYPVYKCYASLPDGHGNIGIIFSRKTPANLIHMFSVIVNDTDGVIECFGFNDISDQEFSRIVKRFYENDIIVEVPAEFCRYETENAEKLTRLKYRDISYEYIAWKTLLKDIPPGNIDLTEGLKDTELSVEALNMIYNAGYFKNWFFASNDSDEYDKFTGLIKTFDRNNFYQQLSGALKDNFDTIFNPVETKKLNHRLLVTAYLLKRSGTENIANMIYSLIETSDYKFIFLDNMLKKSVYEYFLNEKEKYYDLKKSQSIFTRKRDSNIDINFVEFVISEIEKHWVADE